LRGRLPYAEDCFGSLSIWNIIYKLLACHLLVWREEVLLQGRLEGRLEVSRKRKENRAFENSTEKFVQNCVCAFFSHDFEIWRKSRFNYASAAL